MNKILNAFISKNCFYLLIIILSSCASKKDLIYFQEIPKHTEATTYSNLIIKKNDILEIKVSSPDPKISALFSRNASANLGGVNNTEIKKIDGYLVDELGNVTIPLIGSVYLNDLSTVNAKKKIARLLEEFVLEPIVQVRIINYKITLLGEVKNPGTYTFFEERITLHQALGMAGDLTISGQRNNVLLIRNNGEHNTTVRLDLTKDDIINSPYYYLDQNDLIYVYPNTQKIKSSGLIGRTGEVTSVLSLILSTVILLTR